MANVCSSAFFYSSTGNLETGHIHRWTDTNTSSDHRIILCRQERIQRIFHISPIDTVDDSLNLDASNSLVGHKLHLDGEKYFPIFPIVSPNFKFKGSRLVALGRTETLDSPFKGALLCESVRAAGRRLGNDQSRSRAQG